MRALIPSVAESHMFGARQDTGSMLLAGDEEQAADLEQRCEALRAAGQQAHLLDAGQATHAEPALRLPAGGAALLTPRDAQLVRACVGGGNLLSLLCGSRMGCVLRSAATTPRPPLGRFFVG